MKPKLLVAEDHPDMRAVVTGLLERDFDVVASVTSGTAAIEATRVLTPDILVLDVALPILDGTEVAKRLKAQGCIAKIVFISASTDSSQIDSCFDAGGEGYVWKMRLATDLIHAIKEVLEERTFVSCEE